MAENNYNTLKIYHNPRCKKSRDGLSYLQSKTSDIKIIEYLKEGLTIDQIKEILLKSNLKPLDLVRTQENLYKKELKGKKFTDAEWIDILVENPNLLQRPIILGQHKAILAQSAEETDKILKAGNVSL
jgi:arsenate reductase (glutaredoxin)